MKIHPWEIWCRPGEARPRQHTELTSSIQHQRHTPSYPSSVSLVCVVDGIHPTQQTQHHAWHFTSPQFQHHRILLPQGQCSAGKNFSLSTARSFAAAGIFLAGIFSGKFCGAGLQNLARSSKAFSGNWEIEKSTSACRCRDHILLDLVTEGLESSTPS